MTECNAIIEANNEIDKLKRENKKLNELCVQYGFDMGRLEKENEQLKKEEKRLYKYFRKCFDNVSEQGFRETWEVVKKYD